MSTSKPMSANPVAITLPPRSCPSWPTFATRIRGRRPSVATNSWPHVTNMFDNSLHLRRRSPDRVCMSACMSVRLLKRYERIMTQFCGGPGHTAQAWPYLKRGLTSSISSVKCWELFDWQMNKTQLFALHTNGWKMLQWDAFWKP